VNLRFTYILPSSTLRDVMLFCTGDINIVQECQLVFNFKLPSEQLEERKKTLSGNMTFML